MMSGSALLFGATSMLGFQLAKLYPERLQPFISPGNRSPSVRHWPALTLDDPNWIEDLIQRTQPDVLLYCHAVCDVSKCELNPDWAYEVNVRQVKRVLDALPWHTRVVYVSSDHVFGGDGIYTEESVPCPISVYGRTRVDAEKKVLARPGSLVIRVGLGIGDSPDGRTGYRDWLRYRTLQNLPITIIQDEYRSAVCIRELAVRVMTAANSRETGIRHLSATRAVSRLELANDLMGRMGLSPSFKVESRHQQATPHIGRVELQTVSHASLFEPLRSVLES